MTTPVLGQVVLLKTQASPLRQVPGIVSKVIDSDTVNLDAVIDSDVDWPVSNIPYSHPCQLYESVSRGTGVGEWQELSGIPAIASQGSSVSLAVNTARNPSSVRGDSRPTRVTISGTWSWTLNATGTATGTATLKSDSSTTPTTAIATAPFSRGVSVGITVGDAGTLPYGWSYEVPAGDSYLIATSNVAGGGSFGALTITEQVL